MRVYHIRRAVAMLLLATMLLTVFPFTAFAETEPVQSGTEATTAIADPPEDLVEAETGQKTAAPEESLSTDVSTEPEATAQEPDETSDSAVPTEEQTEATAPQDATAPTEIASESTESTTAVDSTEETEETSEEQDAAEAESDSSLVDIVADAITSIFDSLRGESANLTIPYRIYGAGANFGQVLKFWFQYPKNDTGHNVSLEGINGHYINNTVAYCLEPHRGATAGTAFSKLADNTSTNVWTQKLSQNQRNAIALALAYGAPKGLYSNDTNTERGYEVATQIIVWEIIVGDRGAMKPFSRSNDRIYKFMDPIVKANQNNLHTINYNAFVNGYASITNKLTQYGRVPSFASSASSNAPTHTMTYNASNNTYSITLTDNNNVLGNYSFTNGNGLTFTKSGNKLTVTATVAAMQNAPVLITAAGSDYDVSNMAMLIWGASGNQVMCQMANAPAKMSAYFKLNRQPDTSVSLKKTANASQSVLDCIKGNDLYTLQGAVYEIHQGSATGTVVETLTTDKDGNAKGSKKYPVGTVLYAVEKTAPAGYRLNSTAVKLTVSATESNNVFNVKDDPTFDPNSLRLKKTGLTVEKIQGAIFKAEFYAANWADDNKLQRTWYFQSDANGVVDFDDAHLLKSYNGQSSSALFKPNGEVRFPLGCVVVTEIKPAPGYKLPAGNDGKVVMFIRQGGTKTAQMGQPAKAYWGNGSADPLNTSNPKGIYKIENDSVKTTLTGVNAPEEGTATMKKASPNGNVEGYCFKLFQWTVNRSWFGKSDKDGNIYLTDNTYTQSGTKVYTFEGLTDGEFTLLEVLSQHGKDNVWPESIRITVENGGKTVYDKTFSGTDLGKDDNGDCRLNKVKITGLNGKGKMTITVNNKPVPGTATMKKTSSTGDVEGYCFKIYKWVDNISWFGKSDSDGNIYLTDSTYTQSGTKSYTFEGLSDGKFTLIEALSKQGKDVVWPESIHITVENGGKTVFDKTYSGTDLSKDANGDCRLGVNSAPIEITGLDGNGKMTITINNKPVPGSATMQKVAADGDVEGYCFKLYRYGTNQEWYGKSDSDGNIYSTNNTYTQSGTKVYTFEGLTDGKYDFLEVLSQHGKDAVWPEHIQIKVENGGKTVIDKTYSGEDLKKDNNGDCRLKEIELKGLDGNGKMTIIISNKAVPGTASLKKTATNGDVEGYCFKLYRYGTNQEWYGKSDSDGNIYSTDKNYTQSGTKVYTFEGLTDGKFDFLEALSKHGKDNVWPESIQIKVENGGKTVFNKTYKNMTEDANGDCRLSKVNITGLNGGGKMTITIKNTPTSKDVEIIKTSPDGKIEGIPFKVEQQVNGKWTTLGNFTTDENGRIIQNLPIGTVLRITEEVPEGYICLSENPQTITTSDKGNRVSFENQPVAPVEIVKSSPDGKVAGIDFTVEEQVDGKWTMLGTYKSDKDGKIDLGEKYVGTKLRIKEIVPENYICTSNNPQTITLEKGTNKVSFTNKPVSNLELLKTSDDGKVDGIEFVLEQKSGSDKWTKLGSYITDADGRITVEDLTEGETYRLTEIVPEGYISENQVQEFVAQLGTNTVSFSNRRIYGNLELIKVDEDYPDHRLSGAEFTVTLKNGSKTTTKLMTEVVDEEGKGTGVYRLEHIEYGTVCKVRETKAPEGYELSDKVFTETILDETSYQIGDGDFDCVTNRKIYGDLELIKVDEDYPDHKLSGAEFTVTMTNGDDTTTAVMTELVDEDGRGTGVYRLEHIAYETVCEIRETKAPEGYELSDKVYTETILEKKTYQIGDGKFDCVTNRRKVGAITVHKIDAENRPLRGVKMLLEYSTDNGVSWAPVQYRDEEDKIQNGYCTSEDLVDGILVTGADGYVRYAGLTISTEDTKILYRLTEVETLPGLTLLAEPIYYGELTQSAPELAFTATNTASFQMPMTGGFGFTFAGIGFGLTILVALLSLLMLPKRKEQL